MKVIDVTSNSDTSVVAVALAYGARREVGIELMGDGLAAARRIAAAVSAAQEYLLARGVSLMTSARPTGAKQSDRLTDSLGSVRLMVSADDQGEHKRERRLLDEEREDLEEELLAEIAAEAEIDEQIAEDFAERQELPSSDNALLDRLINHTADKPILSGGDLDAAWDKADVGDETVGGTAPTPDQDRVDLLGEAVGLTYQDDEPLDTDAKLERRDEHRWELDPRSVDPRFEVGDTDLVDRDNESEDRQDDEVDGDGPDPDDLTDPDYEVGDTDLIDREQANE